MAKYRYNGKYITEEEWNALPNRLDLNSPLRIQTNVYSEYVSPIDGKTISGSPQSMRNHCNEHDVVQVGDEYKRKRETRNE